MTATIFRPYYKHGQTTPAAAPHYVSAQAETQLATRALIRIALQAYWRGPAAEPQTPAKQN